MFIFNKSKTYPNMKTTNSSCLSKMHQNKHVVVVAIYNPSKFLAKAHWNDVTFHPSKFFRKKYIEVTTVFCPLKLSQGKLIERTSTFSLLKLRRTKYFEKTSIFRSSKERRTKYIETASIFCPSKLHRKIHQSNVEIRLIIYFWSTTVILTSNWRRFGVLCQSG